MSSRSITSPGLKLLNGANVIIWLLDDVSEVGIYMKPKYLRLVILRQDAIDSHLEILKRDTIQAVVAFIFRVEVFITGKEIGGDAFFEHG